MKLSSSLLIASLAVIASGCHQAKSGSMTPPDCTNGPNFTGCACTLGQTKACYTGPVETRGVGACKDGTQTCADTGEFNPVFGPCTNEILPSSGNGECLGASDLGGGDAASPPFDLGPVTCVSETFTSVVLDDMPRTYNLSVAAASSDRILTVVPTDAGASNANTTTFVVTTYASDGSAPQTGAFFDRGGAQVYLHEAIWIAPYYYIAWHEQPTIGTWIGRLDDTGMPVGAPLAIATNAALLRIAAGNGATLEAAYAVGSDTMIAPIDLSAFTLGTPTKVVDGSGASGSLYLEDVAVLGTTTAVTGEFGAATSTTTPTVLLVDGAGTVTRTDFTAYMTENSVSYVAANGSTFLVCGADADGAFGPAAVAYHQWCRTLSPTGTLGTRAELGYRANFPYVKPIAFGGGFAVNVPGVTQANYNGGISAPSDNLTILGLDGSIKQSFDVTYSAPMGMTYPPALITDSGCLDTVQFDVQTYEEPNAGEVELRRYCDAPCP